MGTKPVLRDATTADLPSLVELDRLCFPEDDLSLEPAVAGEIERAVEAGRVRVVTVESRLIALLTYEVPNPSHVFVSAIGVHPEWRRQGFGVLLLTELLERNVLHSTLESQSVSTVTSPANHAMLRMLLSNGFVVRRLLKDYFGPGRDRYYCQYKVKTEYVDPDDRFFVPMSATAHIESLLSLGRYAITGAFTLATGPMFEISHFEVDDLATLQSDETSAGVATSSGILAAITFLLGLSLTSPLYPDAVRIVLMGAALATTFSLIIYANTSGELARLRTNVFSHHMKWGNSLSEFGGVYPFLISLPVAFGRVSSSIWAGLGAALFVTVAMMLYERSKFSIFMRFRQTVVTWTLSIVIACAPVSGVLVVRYGSPVMSWAWAAAVCAALTGLSAVFLTRRGSESLTPQLARRWQSRR
ncbi:N-acetyltransferase [Longispora urticae]